MDAKSEKVRDQVKALAAQFLQRESNHLSLITVTDVRLNHDGGLAHIFFTVLPQDKEKAALEFSKRKRSEFREFVKKNSRIQRLPFFDFAIDEGEKNRQRADELLK